MTPSFFFFIKTLQPLRVAALATYGRRGRSCRRKYHSKQRSEKGACLSFMRPFKIPLHCGKYFYPVVLPS